MKNALGFTLIELLVVITIIVVLLALLVPTLDQAIYQAELVQCAAQQRAIATMAQGYAFDYRRNYPYRPAVRTMGGSSQAFHLSTPHPSVPDDRPVHRSYMGINKFLNDPLGPAKVDLEDTDLDTWVSANYQMWYGWHYHPNGQGMAGLFKLGDRFEWEGRRYSVMVSDVDRPAFDHAMAGHPDADGVLGTFVRQDTSGIANFGPIGVIKQTIAVWWADVPGRGPIDVNTAFEDGSVQRYEKVERNEWEEDGTIRKVPEFTAANDYNTNKFITQLPAR